MEQMATDASLRGRLKSAVHPLKTENDMMTVVSKSDRITDMRRRFDDVEDFICWGEIAEAYFDRSASWFYHKLNGHDGNGRPDGFTRSEAEQLRGAFLDLAERLRKTAEQLEF
jgi:hypothetical protein